MRNWQSDTIVILFGKEKVLLLHKLITEETGGDPNLRDINHLDSALSSAFQTFDGNELYPTKEDKAHGSDMR